MKTVGMLKIGVLMKASLEFKVGLMTIAALLIFIVSILFVNHFNFKGGGRVYTAAFNFLGDLKVNSPVRYAGSIEVGRVKNIRFYNGKAAVDLLITQPDFKLKTDSKVDIYSTSLLGTKYVEIEADLGTGDDLKSDDVIVGRDSNNLDQTFSQLGDVMETFEKMMGDPKSQENILRTFDNMNQATANMLALSISSREKIDKMLNDLSKSSAAAPELMASAQRLSKNLDGLIGSLNKKDVTETMKNMKETMKTMNELTQNIHDGKGAVGVLLTDDQMGDDIKSLVEELKAHPWKLLWKK
jgi:phospholipid/cholesterol/gamma-HCH transport system substrate-binding protein